MTSAPGSFWASPGIDDACRASLLFDGQGLTEVIKRSQGDLIYLATPYTRVVMGPDGKWSETLSAAAADLASSYVACFAHAGRCVVSPIVMAHAMVTAVPSLLDPLDQSFWTRWCAPLLARCDCVVVPEIRGWQDSAGIRHEVTAALSMHRRVYLMGVRS